MNYALTGGSAAREAELQRTLQQLLERYNGTLQPTPGGVAQGTLNRYLLISYVFFL